MGSNHGNVSKQTRVVGEAADCLRAKGLSVLEKEMFPIVPSWYAMSSRMGEPGSSPKCISIVNSHLQKHVCFSDNSKTQNTLYVRVVFCVLSFTLNIGNTIRCRKTELSRD